MQAVKTLSFVIAVAGGLTIGGAAQTAPLPLAAPAAGTDLLVKVHGYHDRWRRGHYERRRERDYRHRRNCFHIGPVTVCD